VPVCILVRETIAVSGATIGLTEGIAVGSSGAGDGGADVADCSSILAGCITGLLAGGEISGVGALLGWLVKDDMSVPAANAVIMIENDKV